MANHTGRPRHPGLRAALILGACVLGMAGCSNDKPTGSDGDDDTIPGAYALAGWIGGDMAPGGFMLAVSRLEPEATSALEATVTLNGQPVPLLAGGSTPDGASYALETLDYTAGETYAIRASLGGRTAACTLTGPAYPRLTLTAPPEAFEFQPGDSIALAWIYDGGPPDSIHIAATDAAGRPLMSPVTIAGADTSRAIPGALTAGWADEGVIHITVDEGEARFPFTGDLAAAGSEVTAAGRADSVDVHPDATPPDTIWTLTLVLDDSALDADGVSTTTARVSIADQSLKPAPQNTPVVFSCDPPGSVVFDPATAYLDGGATVSVVTAGTTPGSVEITASALGASERVALTLESLVRITVGSGDYPQIDWDPPRPAFSLSVRRTGGIGTLEWSIMPMSSSNIPPPVTYGTIPPGVIQVYPLAGAPAALTAGTTYQIVLIDAGGHTTQYTFTHAGD
jgi:hypothetical protein